MTTNEDWIRANGGGWINAEQQERRESARAWAAEQQRRATQRRRELSLPPVRGGEPSAAHDANWRVGNARAQLPPVSREVQYSGVGLPTRDWIGSPEAAEELARRVTAHWAERGEAVVAWTETSGPVQHQTQRYTAWTVRSNMIGGLPRPQPPPIAPDAPPTTTSEP